MINNSNHFTHQGIQANNNIEIFEKYNKDTPNSTLIELIQKDTLWVDVIIKYTDLANNIYKRVFKLKISLDYIDFAHKELQYCIKIISYE